MSVPGVMSVAAISLMNETELRKALLKLEIDQRTSLMISGYDDECPCFGCQSRGQTIKVLEFRLSEVEKDEIKL